MSVNHLELIDRAPAKFMGRLSAVTWPSRSRRLVAAAIIAWTIPMLVIGVMVVRNPWKRTVTHLYHDASANWWAERDLYSGPGGMNYLPHFALAFAPFHELPAPLGDVLWRCGAAALLASGLWRIARQQPGVAAPRAFLIATLLALPLSLQSLRNGQANAVFAGLILHAAASLARQRWWGATGWMVLALALKPLGIVFVLLAPVLYAPLRWRLAAGLTALAALPLLFASPDYVLAQHAALIDNLRSCAAVTEHRFADLNGIVRTFGHELSPGVSKYIRLAAGMATLVLCWLGARRLPEPGRALWLLGLATTYLMLFNPMNESNSYVIIAPAFALWGVSWLNSPATRPAGWAIVFMVVTMLCLPNLLRPLLGNRLALIWHPSMALLFLVMLATGVWSRSRIELEEPSYDIPQPHWLRRSRASRLPARHGATGASLAKEMAVPRRTN